MSPDKRLVMNYTTAGLMPKRNFWLQLCANGHEFAKKRRPIFLASTFERAFNCWSGLKM